VGEVITSFKKSGAFIVILALGITAPAKSLTVPRNTAGVGFFCANAGKMQKAMTISNSPGTFLFISAYDAARSKKFAFQGFLARNKRLHLFN
jgi:hypothetical protein